jgi:hypothetical protein
MSLKTISLDSITTEIDKLGFIKEHLEKCLNRKPLTIQEKIFTQYLKIQNASVVADMLNDMGYRIKTDNRQEERKYISNDITNLFNKPFDITYGCRYLYDFAKAIYLYYKGKATMSQIIKVCERIDVGY